MPAGVLIPSLISAGTSIGQAVIGSKAAKKASQQQVEGGQRGLDVWNQLYANQRQVYNPYLQMGQSALGNLGAMVGRPMPAQAPTGPQPYQMGAFGMPAQAAQPRFSVATPAQAVPRGPGMATVRLRAPDGSEQDIPAEQAEHYISRGAQRVG